MTTKRQQGGYRGVMEQLCISTGGGLIALHVGQNCIKLHTHAPAHTLVRLKYTVHCTKVIFPVAYYVIDMQDIPDGGG